MFREIVATFFEPTNARKVFPSVDDPHFKAVFSLKLIYPKGAKVFSNTEKTDDEREFDQYRNIVRFEDTPLMSTYLFAFAVGNFTSATASTKRGIPVRLFHLMLFYDGLLGKSEFRLPFRFGSSNCSQYRGDVYRQYGRADGS